MPTSCTLILTAAPLAYRAADLAAALTDAGWQVATAMTPNVATWLDDDARATVEKASGWAPRSTYRGPDDPAGPVGDGALVVCPATFNTIGKAAMGIADTYAHSILCERLGAGTPTVMVPMLNAELWSHTAWAGHLDTLRAAGVRFLDPHTGGPDIAAVASGTGGAVTEAFDPQWLVRALAESEPSRS